MTKRIRPRVALHRYIKCVRLLGWAGLEIAVRSALRSHTEVRCRIGAQSMWLRTGTTDLDTLLQIFWNREYDFPMQRSPQVVIDAGANVGYSALYFADRFPDATIYALEPESGNFAQLLKNAALCPHIVPIQAALWHEDAELQVVDAGEGSWGFRVTGDGASVHAVRGYSVQGLMAEHALDRIDLLKLDVEGSEKEIFESSADWIGRVEVLVAELHDKYRPGCARAFYNATNDFPHETRCGENVVLSRSA